MVVFFCSDDLISKTISFFELSSKLFISILGKYTLFKTFASSFKSLKKLINEEIVDKVDHKNLNVDVDFLKDVIPTAENIAIHFWDIIEPKIESGELHEIKLFESERNFVIYRGAEIERPH